MLISHQHKVGFLQGWKQYFQIIHLAGFQVLSNMDTIGVCYIDGSSVVQFRSTDELECAHQCILNCPASTSCQRLSGWCWGQGLRMSCLETLLPSIQGLESLAANQQQKCNVTCGPALGPAQLGFDSVHCCTKHIFPFPNFFLI